jgi:hypothetical protein
MLLSSSVHSNRVSILGVGTSIPFAGDMDFFSLRGVHA